MNFGSQNDRPTTNDDFENNAEFASGEDESSSMGNTLLPSGGTLASHPATIWGTIGILGLAIVGLAIVGSNRLERQAAAFDARIPTERVEGLDADIQSLDQRLSTLAGRIVPADVVEGLAGRVDGLERAIDREIATTNAELEALTDDMAQADAELPWRIELGVEDRTSAIRARIGELEATIRERDAQLGDLVTEIERLRQEVRLGLTNIQRDGDIAERAFEHRVANAERRLDVVAYAVDRDRIDFEMFTDYSAELSPGIRLHVNKIDRGRQQVSGWIHLVPEGRIIRIADHPIQQSLVFYTHQDDRAHELVFTRVTPSAAVGYIRIPSESLVQSADGDWAEPSVALAVN